MTSLARKPIQGAKEILCTLYRRHIWVRRLDRFRTGIWGIKNQLQFKYPHRILFIAGMAKSGSSWVHAFLRSIPGFQRPPIVDRSAVAKGELWDDTYFSNIPKFGYYALKTHASASPELLEIIHKMNLPTLITYRDIRDQLVSRFHHILVDPNSLHYKLYNELPREEAFSHSIEYAIDPYRDWIDDWLKVAEKEPNVYKVISYEQLLKNTFEVYRDILLFYGIDLPDHKIRSIMVVADAQTKGGVGSLAERIRVGGGANFRGGRTGDWRNHFSRKDVELVKERAGEQLIRLGYEKDMNWGL
ncbi:MAG: hypothetical protein HN472_14695 [Nitrospina sp.]|jgi:hypothetical protein|nr:hypothetical protein [Nitrospina sp.]MBT4049142.1 hypothetical protein [Nitrospina sp.]MBT4557699.1 hypothetical protein [Nitrospina sp.]MBT6739625.1 hypothetical protein [Nitrospina sp.]MBT7198811.1 hypothetical protein [Nitrospina sp.]